MSRRQRHRYEKVEQRGVLKFIRLASGRVYYFWDAVRDIESAETSLGRATSRAFKLADDEWDLERVEWRMDKIESYIGAVRQELEKRRGVRRVEERIALLRNTSGRSPEEAAAFLRKANELEGRL